MSELTPNDFEVVPCPACNKPLTRLRDRHQDVHQECTYRDFRSVKPCVDCGYRRTVKIKCTWDPKVGDYSSGWEAKCPACKLHDRAVVLIQQANRMEAAAQKQYGRQAELDKKRSEKV